MDTKTSNKPMSPVAKATQEKSTVINPTTPMQCSAKAAKKSAQPEHPPNTQQCKQ